MATFLLQLKQPDMVMSILSEIINIPNIKARRLLVLLSIFIISTGITLAQPCPQIKVQTFFGNLGECVNISAQ